MGLVIALVVLLGAPAVAAVSRRRRRRGGRDEYFVDLVPGLLPGPDQAPSRRTGARAGELVSQAAVRLTPPDGVPPVAAGLLLDREVRARDLSAGFLDLAVRGFFRIRRPGPHENGTRRGEWVLEPPLVAASGPLSEAERQVLATLFPRYAVTTLAARRSAIGGPLRGLRDDVEWQARRLGWFGQDRAGGVPTAAALGLFGIVLLVVAGSLGGVPDPVKFFAVVSMIWSVISVAIHRVRPRTAEGTAMAVQVAASAGTSPRPRHDSCASRRLLASSAGTCRGPCPSV
ncbi:DUF2207 family protein [Luteipulveratus flavus]|uniref:DUF2207 domain-containing protein n=1 Tax=Luteipulveratus flavus TaxID=3031728 RepID=A0ABT6C801_9MICO|nr:DUF2207 domain-containing protein [Luteipulveratus sp. YIM 133296]MDF8265042.1 DUF2207 domain-containing protein [Luteipulveratus sp. YIM 133296]